MFLLYEKNTYSTTTSPLKIMKLLLFLYPKDHQVWSFPGCLLDVELFRFKIIIMRQYVHSASWSKLMSYWRSLWKWVYFILVSFPRPLNCCTLHPRPQVFVFSLSESWTSDGWGMDRWLYWNGKSAVTEKRWSSTPPTNSIVRGLSWKIHAHRMIKKIVAFIEL